MKLSHETLVDRVFARLTQKHYYPEVMVHKEYSRNGLEGELDLVTFRGTNAHYYEVKETLHAKSYLRARNQFRRCRNAFPQYDWKFILITNSCVRRVRL